MVIIISCFVVVFHLYSRLLIPSPTPACAALSLMRFFFFFFFCFSGFLLETMDDSPGEKMDEMEYRTYKTVPKEFEWWGDYFRFVNPQKNPSSFAMKHTADKQTGLAFSAWWDWQDAKFPSQCLTFLWNGRSPLLICQSCLLTNSNDYKILETTKKW